METQVETRLGGSLPVPCVQELAKEPLITVPPRYICADQEPPHAANTTLLPQIPIIDMQRLLSGDAMDYELDKFHYACKEWGFFQVINHEVSTSLIEKVKHEIQEFFKLSIEEKQKYWQQPGDLEGFGQAFVVSDEQKLDWGDLFYIVMLPVHMRKTSLFSSLPESFSMAYRWDSQEEDVLPRTIVIKTNRVDQYGTKDCAMSNMEQERCDHWINDDMVTNGAYRSIEHRATINPVKERLSIATFYSPKLDVEMGPAPSLINPQNPALFKRIITGDFFKGFFARELRGKSYLDAMRI